MVRIKINNTTNSGRRIGWTKLVESVDESKSNGYAFVGEFLADGKEFDVPENALLISCDPKGSVKNGWKSGHIYKIDKQSECGYSEITTGEYNWRNDFLTFRDEVARKLIEFQNVVINPLEKYTDEEIINEAKLRGLMS